MVDSCMPINSSILHMYVQYTQDYRQRQVPSPYALDSYLAPPFSSSLLIGEKKRLDLEVRCNYFHKEFRVDKSKQPPGSNTASLDSLSIKPVQFDQLSQDIINIHIFQSIKDTSLLSSGQGDSRINTPVSNCLCGKSR